MKGRAISVFVRRLFPRRFSRAQLRVPRPAFRRMSTRRPAYKHVDDVEPLENYRPGGYHPIWIRDILGSRYRIVHKLGYGSFSTTWLARDEQLAKYVAVKVGTADSTRKEVGIMTQLANPSPGRNGKGHAFLPPVYDSFDIQGPNGTHPCLITAPARCSIADSKDLGGIFQLCAARAITAQLALAVAYMHNIGYVHGGTL